MREAMLGFPEVAREQAQIALKGADAAFIVANAAMAYAIVGDAGQVTRLSADLAKRFPRSTEVQAIHLPEIRAMALLYEGREAGGKMHVQAFRTRHTGGQQSDANKDLIHENIPF
jgi:hypothetical protein